MRGSYRSAERIFIWFTIPFFAYPIAAILAHPHWGAVGKAIVVPHIHSSSAYLLLLIATAGTTITPYMQLYLQSAVVERGVREEELPHEEREAVAGAVFANLIAAFIIIATGATLFTHGIHSISSAADAARALTPFAGHYAEVLFGIGLLGASLLAAAILPIATSYVISESLGYEKGVGQPARGGAGVREHHHRDDPVQRVRGDDPRRTGDLLLVGVQVVNGLLLPINLFFIWRLARSRPRDGRASQPRDRSTAPPASPWRSPRRSRSRSVVITRAGPVARATASRDARRRAVALVEEQRRADRAAEIAERRHVDVRRAQVGEQVRLHRLGDPLGVGMAEPHAQPAADDHALDVEHVDGRRDPRAERPDRAVDASGSPACRRDRAHAPRCRWSGACARAPSSA